jgi:DNA-binding NarL/FixJ family response regulator
MNSSRRVIKTQDIPDDAPKDKQEGMPIPVAMVEDDAETRAIITGWLRRAVEFKLVAEYGRPSDAVDQLPPLLPEVVLMDINLPGMTGIECVRRLKLVLPTTQFVMLTVYGDTDHIFDALAAGASGYLLKDTPRADLLNALHDVHRGGSPMTSDVARKVVQSFRRPTPALSENAELSDREHQVLDSLARGFLYKEIADQLGISVTTVNTYIRRIYEKLHVRSRAQAVAKYIQAPGGH